jgi:hypothetical protein
MEALETYQDSRKYFVVYKGEFEGEIILGRGNHGGETYIYLSHIEWDDDNEPENSEEIETYLEANLNELVLNAEKI